MEEKQKSFESIFTNEVSNVKITSEIAQYELTKSNSNENNDNDEKDQQPCGFIADVFAF